MNAREAAAEILVAVACAGRSLERCAEPILACLPAGRERALAQELAWGTLRWLPRLRFLARRLLSRPLRPADRDLELVIALGLYQLLHTRVARHAAVASTVELAAARGKPRARGLVNAVLRRFLREREALLEAADGEPEARHAHPRWLLEALRGSWPAEWPEVAAANNARAPLALRVNRRRASREGYRRRLAEQGIESTPIAATEDGLALAEGCDVRALPGFAEGLFSVQDGAAQLAAPILDPRPGERVLDACAAPGGKSAHLLERCPGLAELTALDRCAERLARLEGTLARLGLAARTLRGDAREPGGWWDGRPFERILLDAPCSGSGVIRRHPDIKALRRATDLPALAAAQGELLAALWPLLAEGGSLLYATCSVLVTENDAVIEQFLERHPGARAAPIAIEVGRPTRFGRQILPGENGMDGFYYARLEHR